MKSRKYWCFAPTNTTTTVDEIIQIPDAISTSDYGRNGAETDLGYPVKCSSTVVENVELIVSDLEKKNVHEKVS